MMRTLLLACLAGIFQTADAQYFYKDIVSNKQAAADMASYKDKKVKSIRIKSFEDDGSPSDGFFAEKRLSRDYSKSELLTRTNVSGKSLLTTYFNGEGKLTMSHDSSEISTTQINYFYDEDGRVLKVVSTIRSADDDFVNEITEEHIYVYGEEFMPEKMLKVKNRMDTTTILFMLDENKNIAIEKDTRNGSKFYYYYDEKSRLSDIAQANEFRQKVRPDYMFKYNNAGDLVEMTTTQEGGSGNDYFVWKYTYDDGLRVTEKCFSKERRLLGSIEYQYKK